jgi:hypothetical protein
MLVDDLKNKVKQNLITPRVLLSRARLLHSNDWNTGVMNDCTYFPFYYHLAKFIHPQKVFEYGFNLGLVAASFTQNSCVKKYLGYQETHNNEYFSFRLGKSTLREYYNNELQLCCDNKEEVIKSDKWDLIILSEITESYDIFWNNLNGWMVVDHLLEQKDEFINFCKICNREPIIFEEIRYGIGMVKK